MQHDEPREPRPTAARTVLLVGTCWAISAVALAVAVAVGVLSGLDEWAGGSGSAWRVVVWPLALVALAACVAAPVIVHRRHHDWRATASVAVPLLVGWLLLLGQYG